MSPPRRLTMVPLAAICALGIAACGSDKNKSSSTSGTATDAATTHETTPSGPVVATQAVSETEFKLTPPNPTVAKAGLVEIKATNAGTIDHAIEVEGQGVEVKTNPITPGSSASLKVDLKPGTYEWYCPLDSHKQKGMKGEITVGSVKSSSSSETTTTSTSTSGGGSSGGGAAYPGGSSTTGGGSSNGGGAAYP
jgi:plastocyanin